MQAVEDAALAARSTSSGRARPALGGMVGIDHRLHHVVVGGEQRRVGHVDAGAHLRRARRSASDISSPFTVISTASGSVAVDLLVVEHVLEALGAVGDRGDAGAHLALGVVHAAPRRPPARCRCRTWRTAPGSAARRRRLAAICARRSDSRSRGTWQFSRIRSCTSFCSSPAAIEPHRRDAQALLVDVGVAAVDEVGMVREVHRPGDHAGRRRRSARRARCRADACRRPRRRRCR